MEKKKNNDNGRTELTKALNSIQERLTKIEATKNNKMDSRLPRYDGTYYPAKKECCCFEIILYRARVIKDQGGLGSTEPADGGIVNKNMELIFGVTADGFNGVHPSITGNIQMSQDSGWHVFNQKIALVAGNQSIPVSASAREVEVSTNPLVIAIEGRAEYGTSDTSYMNLRCDCPTVPIQFDIKLNGGGSINTRGVVMVEVMAGVMHL